MNAFNVWLKAQSPAVQSLIYALETGLATALAAFLFAVYTAATSQQGLTGFDWHTQLHDLEMGAIGAAAKALFDFIKGNAPTQSVPAPAPAPTGSKK